MTTKLQKTILFMTQPKVVLLGITILLLFYIGYRESEFEKVVGCWDCGYETRQAFYLFLASSALFVRKIWSAVISFSLSLKVTYSIGYWTFWNDFYEVKGTTNTLKEAIRATYEYHQHYFIVLTIGLIICFSAITLFNRSVEEKHLQFK